MPAPRRSLVVLLALAVLAATGCVREADDDPLSAGGTATTERDGKTRDTTDTTATEGPEGFVPDPIEWDGCFYGECGTLEVPLDYSDPDGKTIELGVARAPATGDRIGALFVNPGGPGAAARDYTALAYILPPEINEHFDIVGVDPRGVGESAPIDCGVDPAELYSVDHSIEDEADREALLEVSSSYAEDCAEKFGDVLPHLGTRDVARDMDAVRASMGDEQLSYLGFSFGTAIGQVYADLFPERVRSMVLDAIVELGPSGLQTADTQAAGFELALSRYVQFCDAAEGCETAGNALGAVEEVLALAERPGGIPARSADRPAGPGEVNLGISLALYSEPLWPDLDSAVADALGGDGSGLVELADRYLGLGSTEIYFAVNCLDFAWPTGEPQAFLDAAEATAVHAPHFGEALVNDYIRCADWPVAPTPLEPVSAPGAPPILVISTTGDPATPYENGVAVADRLATGVLITNEGDGHTVVSNGKPCIDAIVVAYLVDATVPEDGTTCR